MNLYKGMDIGTAKPSFDHRKKVDYAGVDLARPTEKFSVANYLEAVKPTFTSGREIIVSGGTGLYVKCLTEGFDDVSPENSALRTELEMLDFQALEKRAQKKAEELYSRLTPDDRQNPRRLIRILERTAAILAAPSGQAGCLRYGVWNSKPKPTLVGLHIEREVLHKRIEGRVEQMYASGLLEEAAGLMKLNKITEKQARERTVIRTRQFAKRQMTWFRNQLNVEWIDTAGFQSLENLAEAVSSAWGKIGATPVNI